MRRCARPCRARSPPRWRHPDGPHVALSRPDRDRRAVSGGLGKRRAPQGDPALHPAEAERRRRELVGRRAEPSRLALGDAAHHARGAGRRGVLRRGDRASVLALADPRTEPLPLCGDPAGDADRRDRAAHHHLGARAVSRAFGLRLDRRVFPDRLEHHGRAQQRRPQPLSAVSPLRRLARAGLAVSPAADRAALFSRGPEDQRRARPHWRGGRRIRRRHRRRRNRARLPHSRSRLPPGDPAPLRGALSVVADRDRDLPLARPFVAPALAPLARKRDCRGGGVAHPYPLPHRGRGENYPRPTNGILVAITVMNWTLASGVTVDMKTTARATFCTSMTGSTTTSPLGCGTPRVMRWVISVSALPTSIWPHEMSYLRPSSEVDLVRPVIACLALV